MRTELETLLLLDWLEARKDMDECYGYGDHVEAVLAMRPTSAERPEIGQLLVDSQGESQVLTLTGIMYEEPDAAYLPFLVACLDCAEGRKKRYAMRALLRGGYEGALDVLFNRPDVQQAMGDELPWELWGVAEELPERWQRQILERFNERFRDDPPFNMQTHQWFRTLASIPVTDEVTAETMLRTWNRLGRGDHQQRYLLLHAMAAAPVAAYEPILAKYAKSRRFDIRDFARAGLDKLRGEG
jgi:hypothetical protein